MWPAVLASAWLGGFGPGLLATLLSVLTECYFVIEPRFSLQVDKPDVQVGLALFVLLGIVVSFLVEWLHRANRALRAAARRKDAFLALLGHELRGQMAPILPAAEMLSLEQPPEKERERARDMIKRQLGHMSRLVSDLLDASRVQQGKVQLQKRPLELAKAITEAIETARPSISARNHRLTVSLPPEPLWVQADPTRLGQILVNLLTNAARYTAEGGRIEFSAARKGSQAVIGVKDNGIGIPPDMLSRIFEPFTQIHEGAMRSQEGLGLGLALVKNLVELHDGTITACSAGPGKGSEFVLRLPVSDYVAEERTVFAGRVLIVDDNKSVRDGLAMLLQAWGCETHVAHDGPTAVRLAKECQPGVVLMDIQLPGLDGYQVAKQLKQEPSLQETMLVALTGYGADEDRHRSTQAGFDAHLVKPVGAEELLKLLQEGGCP
jgi:signal transduction histidine kinase/CheY-like chemotaxis protein